MSQERNSVAALDKILGEPIKVLDHGFIRVIDYMGDDSAIVQAARVSYGKGTKKLNEDKGLINYLMRHYHTTPFEMCEIKFHIKLPIFVARQWIRHRTANVNEYSARYSVLSDEFYVPSLENLAAQSTLNNQGREGLALPNEQAEKVAKIIREDSENCYYHYQQLLNQEGAGKEIDDEYPGLARELARMNLTLNYYTEWYWKIDLHNLLHFIALRADAHAQYEIRVYAEKILDIVKLWVPYTYEAFCDYRLNSANLSSKALSVVKSMIKGEKPEREQSGMSKREWNDLMRLLDIE
jgi:thymidylate synthase (FAD)